VACALLLALCTVFTAYHRTFVSLANYDDEGYMMWTVKNFLGGQALYDQVATIYGPFYYLYEWCALSLTGVSAASDSLRLVSVAFWVAAALVAFVLAYRATGSLLLAVCVHLLVFRALGFIGEEPAHPQEACILLLLALCRAFYIANRTLRMVMMGALGGAMVASKINLGVFVLVALAVGLAYVQPPGWRRNAARLAVTLGALALPVALMSDRLNETWAVFYCVLVVLALASVLLTIRDTPPDNGLRGVRDAAVLAGAFVATAAAISCFALARGSTLHNLFHWLIVLPRRESGQSWSYPANIHPEALAWAAIGLVVAWCVARRKRADRWVALLKLAFGAAVLLMCMTNRYEGLLNYATPFLWLVATRPGNTDASPGYATARGLLALLGAIQVLYAYPVAGSQVVFVAVLMIVVAAVCFWDGLSWLRRNRLESLANRIPNRWLTVARVSAALLIAGLNLAFAWDARRTYESFSPLGFPGSRLVRVEPDKAAALRAIVSRINSSCTTLLTEPGLFSFHLWTGKPSPGGVDHQLWMSLLDDATQNAIVDKLSRDPQACVVYQQELAKYWAPGADIQAKPMVRYIRENFHTVIEGAGYSLMMRNGTAD
jgi:hypothetical protein